MNFTYQKEKLKVKSQLDYYFLKENLYLNFDSFTIAGLQAMIKK
jgi:hypothetical protein